MGRSSALEIPEPARELVISSDAQCHAHEPIRVEVMLVCKTDVQLCAEIGQLVHYSNPAAGTTVRPARQNWCLLVQRVGPVESSCSQTGTLHERGYFVDRELRPNLPESAPSGHRMPQLRRTGHRLCRSLERCPGNGSVCRSQAEPLGVFSFAVCRTAQGQQLSGSIRVRFDLLASYQIQVGKCSGQYTDSIRQ